VTCVNDANMKNKTVGQLKKLYMTFTCTHGY